VYIFAVNPSGAQKNGQNFQKDPSEIRQGSVRETSAGVQKIGPQQPTRLGRAENGRNWPQ
jgi:hypothetical protein